MTAEAQPEQGTCDDARRKALRDRDIAADGSFVYGVKTTGIYCRPSCPSRHARAENIVFFDNADAAHQAGFRPCKRCQPDLPPLAQRQAEIITSLCRYIETTEQTPTLAELARVSGFSRYHLHRLFKQTTGLTPKDYMNAQRARRVRQGLQTEGSITAAIYEAGYPASSRFYAQSTQLLGMTPTHYRAGAPEDEIRFAVGACSLGAILVAASARGICAISLGEDPDALVRELQACFHASKLIGADSAFEQWVAQVVGLVEAPALGLRLPLDIRGTVFQQRVWRALQEIPPGETVSYGELARRIGQPSAARAVAHACASNTLAIAIPCHRVVRIDGGLSGYRWGVERKRALLEREKHV